MQKKDSPTSFLLLQLGIPALLPTLQVGYSASHLTVHVSWEFYPDAL